MSKFEQLIDDDARRNGWTAETLEKAGHQAVALEAAINDLLHYATVEQVPDSSNVPPVVASAVLLKAAIKMALIGNLLHQGDTQKQIDSMSRAMLPEVVGEFSLEDVAEAERLRQELGASS